MDIPGSRGAGCSIGASGWTGAAAEHGGDTGHQCLVNLLGADKMNVGIDTTGGENMAFTGEHFSARPNNNIDAALGVGVAGFPYSRNASFFNPHIGFNYAPVIDD